ncbi:MAG: hypothetical protein IT440_13960 [Phycisphaeraceae bacterium]|nr:hypothetical protein [Phycisphaeraceae bacterium]
MLESFWHFIWMRPGLAASGAEWRACFGDAAWDMLRQRLFTGQEIARVCRRANDQRLVRVVQTSSGYHLVCETTGNIEAWDVPEEDVRNYRLDVTVLRDMITEALDIIAEPGLARRTPGAWPLGDWRPRDAVTVPAFLMLPPTAKLLAAEIQRLLLEAEAGFVLFVPQQPRLDAQLRASLERRRAVIIALPDVVMWDGTQLGASLGWDTYRHAYCVRHLSDQLVPAPPAYEFRKTGDYWTVRFNGQFTTIKDAVGLTYIAHLLASRRRKVFAPELLQAVTGESAVAQVSSAGALTDQQTLADLKQSYLDTQRELEKAARNHDVAAQERLRHELDGLSDYLKKVKGLGGRTREASDDADKIRRAITQAIGRTLDSLGADDKLPAAAQHLRNAIKTGLFMSYEPEEEWPWAL